jgi:hypothetical protein
VVQFRWENKTVKKNVAKHGIILRIIKSHRKLQIVSPKIASHQNGAFLACSDREVCITENCKCIIENCKRITENCKEVSLKIARKYHRKLQAQSILIHDKKRGKHRAAFPRLGGHSM